MAWLGLAGRNPNLEHAHERILEGYPVRISGNANGIQRVVFRLVPGKRGGGDDQHADRDDETRSTHGSMSFR